MITSAIAVEDCAANAGGAFDLVRLTLAFTLGDLDSRFLALLQVEGHAGAPA